MERIIGTRKPGQFFGEVPLTLSTNFPASGRAAGAARIIKLDVAGYYTLAAMAPSVPEQIGSLARRYLDSLQELAAEKPDAVARVIGPRRDAKVRELSTFLTRNHVAFERITLEEPAGRPALPGARTARRHPVCATRRCATRPRPWGSRWYRPPSTTTW